MKQGLLVVAAHELKLLHIVWLINEVHLMQLVTDNWEHKYMHENSNSLCKHSTMELYKSQFVLFVCLFAIAQTVFQRGNI
jgi:hypothetical protein